MLSSSIGINFILTVTSIVFFIGLFGVILNRKNTLMIIMSIEILLLAINLNFAALSVYLDDVVGHVFVFFVLTVAAAESAIGLSIITTSYKMRGTLAHSTKIIKKNDLNKKTFA